MVAVRHSTTWVGRDGQRHELGAYKHQAQAGLATDLANLLQAHFSARSGGGAAPQPELSMLPAASMEDLAEREEWAELCGAPSLEQAIRLLADSQLAEQVRRGCCWRVEWPGGTSWADLAACTGWTLLKASRACRATIDGSIVPNTAPRRLPLCIHPAAVLRPVQRANQ